MNILKRLGAIVTNNLWLKIVSLIFAFVLWFVVAQINNPFDTVTFKNVKVILVNADTLSSSGKVYQILNDTDIATVTVRAPESVIRTLNASDVTAIADFSQITPEGNVPIVYSLDRAESIVGDHDALVVSVEDKATKYVNILYETVGSVGEGCVQGKVNLERNRLEVTGPKSAVDRVSYALVTIDLDGAVKTISADMEIMLCDSEGRRVESDNIIKQTDYVTTTVTVLSTKTVPVYASVSGEPAAGYIFTGNIHVDPEVVTIAGDTSVLNTISVITITDPVDIGGAKGDTVATYNLSDYLPGGVTFEDADFDDEVSVTAYVEKSVDKTIYISSDSLIVTDVPDGFEAHILDDENIAIRLSGLENELNAITAGSLSGVVEVSPYLTTSFGEAFGDGDIVIVPIKFHVSDHVKVEAVYVRVLLSVPDENDTDG